MTRSVGTRLASKVCIAEPESFEFRCKRGSSARVVLASDGLWDVASSEKVVKILNHEPNAARASDLLTKYARYRRRSRSLRMDDITVIVVNVGEEVGVKPVGLGRSGCCAVM